MTSRSVYSVSIDSRSRNDDEPDNQYTVNLDRTLDRIKTIQLGSFQFQDARYAFDSVAEMNFSEPINIPADTFLSFLETTTTLTKATNARSVETREISILLPPTLNPLFGMAGDVVTTTENTGLLFGVNYYPEAGLRMRVVGADFPEDLNAIVTAGFPTDAGPLLTSTTTLAPYTTSTANAFTYATNYLSELMGGVGNKVLRHRSAGAYTSYLHAPRPTLVELFVMLNVATRDLTVRTDINDTITAATNATPIVVTTTVANGLVTGDQVVVSGVLGNTAANGTFKIVALTTSSFQLVGSVGNGAYAGGGALLSPQQLRVPATFGFNNVTNKIACAAPTRVSDNGVATVTRNLRLVGSLAALLGFNDINLNPVAEVDANPAIKRNVALKPGTFTSTELVQQTPFRMNPGDMEVAVAADRTFHYIMPVGTPDSFVFDYGLYTGQQLADFATAVLNPLPNQITVTYSATTNRFTFTHNLGLKFGLDFQQASETMRQRFGFDPIVYANQATYTSVRPAVFAVHTTAEFPLNTYDMTENTIKKQFSFHTRAPTSFYAVSGTSTSGTSAAWAPLALDALPYAQRFRVGDVLTGKRPTLSSTQAGAKAITDATNAAPIVVTTAAAHGLTTGDNLTIANVEGNTAANGTWFVTVTAATTFELDGGEGNATYTAATGDWWTNVSFVTGTQKSSATYTAVVQSVWDASTATPLITLEPTASIFSVQDAGTASRAALGTPGVTDGRIILQSDARNVFQLHFQHPEGSPDTFGFPPVAWPPSEKTILSPSTTGRQILRTLPQYDPASLSIPVSNSYTAPGTWNLLPPDYMNIVLRSNCFSNDIHTHSFRGASYPIFAKMLISFPYVNISEEMLFTAFSGHGRVRTIGIEFQNPDGSLVEFNGRPHTYSLLFTLEEDKASLTCF